MLRPETIEFTGLSIGQNDTRYFNNVGTAMVVRPEWARITFRISSSGDTHWEIINWLVLNCEGRFSQFRYYSPEAGSREYVYVIRFESVEDAVMFKLQDVQNIKRATR